MQFKKKYISSLHSLFFKIQYLWLPTRSYGRFNHGVSMDCHIGDGVDVCTGAQEAGEEVDEKGYPANSRG